MERFMRIFPTIRKLFMIQANQAAERMFTLYPPPWYLKSTINNISLIQRFRKRHAEKMGTNETIFQFWLDYFSDAIAENVEDSDQIRFPVCKV